MQRHDHGVGRGDIHAKGVAISNPDSETFDRDQFRANLLKYTRKAYRMLPQLDKPRILDIGCGSGVATLELARVSGGDIVGVDTDNRALEKLAQKAQVEKKSGRVTVVHTSMLKMDFPASSFDVIWTEGAISFIGFERGLREWRHLLVPSGYLVVHDVLSDLQKKIELARACGYTIAGHFELPPQIWWDEYYTPLKGQLEALRATRPVNREVANEMKRAEREIREFDPESDRFGSVFFVLKRR
jgi:SAM-dependent methyltransferase